MADYVHSKRRKSSSHFVSLVDEIAPEPSTHMIHKHTIVGDGESERLKNLPRPPQRVSSVVAPSGLERRSSLVAVAQQKFMQSVGKTSSNLTDNDTDRNNYSISQPGAERVEI